MSFNALNFRDTEARRAAYFSVQERAEIANYLDEYLKDLQYKYHSLPVTMDTLGKRRRKVELEGLLDEVQGFIYMMRGSRPIKKSDFPPKNSRFRECMEGDANGMFDVKPSLNDPSRYVFW